MAFAMTNKAQINYNAPGQGAAKLHYELADQVAAGTLTDTAIAGLKFARVRIVVKSGMANGNTILWMLRVDNAEALGSPELVYTSPTYTFVTNDTNLTHEFVAFSETGFRAFKLTATESGGTAVFDVMVDLW